jgi:tetratricopeptide (TPR) repeat protein
VEETDRRVPVVWALVILLLLALRAIATFAWPVRLWGLDSLAYRGSLWALLLVPFALPLLKRPTLAVGRAATRLARGSLPLTLGFAGLMGALFALFKSRNFLLGDSLLYIHALREGIQIESAGRREAGATIVVSALHWSLRRTAFVDSQMTFVIASVSAGVAYVLLCMAVARLLARTLQARGLILSSMIALGGLQIFFGHAEYYSMVAASGMLYVLLALRWAKGRDNLVLPALALALALFVHLMNLLLLFSFLWLIVCAYRSRRRAQAVTAAVLVPAILLVIAVLIHYPRESIAAIFSRGKHLLPLVNTDPDFYAYGLFDLTHLREIANELLLTATCLPLIGVAALWALRRRNRDAGSGGVGAAAGRVRAKSRARALADREVADAVAAEGTVGEIGVAEADRAAGELSAAGRSAAGLPAADLSETEIFLSHAEPPCPRAIRRFLLWAAVGAALFTFSANPALGMARDWDIFAFPFMVMTLAAATAAASIPDRRRVVWLCGAVTIVGGLHLALFVSGNRTPSSYVPRFRRIAMHAELFAPTPRAELWRYLAWEEIKAGDIKQAKEDLLESIKDYHTQVKAYKMLAVIDIGEQFDWLASPAGRDRREVLDIETQEQMNAEAARLGLNYYYNSFVDSAPNKVRALIGAGIAAMNVEAPDSLIVDAFKRAVETDPEDLEARAFWGDMLRTHGFYDKAEEQYNWVLSRRRWQVRAYIGRACVIGARGEPEEAFILVKELREHYAWSIEAQQFLLEWREGKLKTKDDFRLFLVTQ